MRCGGGDDLLRFLALPNLVIVMSAGVLTLAIMILDPSPAESRLDRGAFAAASPRRRHSLTGQWMSAERLQAADAHFVSRVRERDLADARAQFAPFLTMTAILFAMFALSMAQGMLPVLILAGTGMLASLFGAWHALRSIAHTSRQLTALDARSVHDDGSSTNDG